MAKAMSASGLRKPNAILVTLVAMAREAAEVRNLLATARWDHRRLGLKIMVSGLTA